MKSKKLVALLLASAMCLTLLAGCKKGNVDTTPTPGAEDTQPPVVEAKTYTYNSYASALATNWNPHTWEMNSDDTVLGYLSSGFVDISIEDSENGVYQWVYDMATYIKDVTADHKDDLTKYGCSLPAGQEPDDVSEGFVFEIGLNPDAKWQDGSVINADSYIYSMKELLNPKMHNYRSNLYWSGESAVAGGLAYYNSGCTAKLDNGSTGAYVMADFVKGDDGVYTTPTGGKAYVAVSYNIAQTGGSNSLADYVGAYGDAYFGMDRWEELTALADKDGLAPLTDDTLAMLTDVTTTNAAWAETDGESLPNYIVYEETFPEVEYDATVGCYKVDDYTIRYVTQTAQDLNYFLVSCTSTWLVHEATYEAGKDTTGELTTTNYNTSVETTMSYGPYKLVSLQPDRQMVFEKNEYWFGYTKLEDGTLYSETNFEVDGQKRQQYQTDRIVIDKMEEDAAKQAFLKGELTDWSPNAEELLTYGNSDRLIQVDQTYTMSFFFNCALANLQEMDRSKGNTNSVVLSNENFRKAMSLAIDRAEYVTATAGYKPAYATMNTLYFYDVYNDPTSSYRSSDPAMQAICNLYGVEYGEGKAYATLKEAYQSINGFNLSEAKELMKTACEELVAAGLYTAGEDIYVRIGWAAGAMTSSANNCVALLNKFINAALEGSGFGKITFEGIGNISDRYADTAAGEYAIGYGAWGGAAFYPFRNFQVYCDPDQYSLHEAGCWDPTTTNLTLKVNGEDVTMTWQEWSGALIGSGVYANADNQLKLEVTAQMEEAWLKLYYRIPLCSTTGCEILAYKCNYYTEDYNIMYGFGGLRLMSYNYDDAAWTQFVAGQGGTLSYE